MTLTIKDSLDVTGTSKSGSPAQNSVNTPGQSPRSNPVCLEVPVTIRSLPGEDGNAPGAAGPTREEGRSVIVFDNGGVLRMANPLAPGRTVILSNQQGRDVVCRVVGGRNLPNIKGYIEVEFIEPVNDFWHIHQTLEPPRAASRPALELPAVPMQPSQVEQAVAALLPSRPAIPAKEKESDAATRGAPTFEDVAGLVLMSVSGAPREKKNEPAAPLLTPSGKNEPAHAQLETTSLKSTDKPAPPISELPSDRPAPSVVPAALSTPARTQILLHEFTGKGSQVSLPSSFASVSSGEPRGRTPLLLGGAALVLAGLGAGYFFMHRGTSQVAEVPAAAASQPSALSADASSGSRNAPAPQAAVEQAPVQTPPQAAQPVSTASSETAGNTARVSTERQDTRSRSTTADAKQPDPAAARRQPIPNLKMSSPISSGKKLAKLADGSPAGAEDLSLTMAAGGTSPPAFAVRAVSQPAPPPAEISTPSAARASVDAKLISSTRPVYPAMAKETRVQGSVVIRADVDEKGSVVGAKTISGPPFLRQAAVDAVKQWKYSPAQINGKPAASQVTVSIQFQLN